MAEDIKENRLKSLDKNEIRIVFYICQGMDSEDLAGREDLGFPNITVKTIAGRLTKIYKKLEIEGKKNKEESLILEYCPTIKKLLPTLQEVNTWIPTKTSIATSDDSQYEQPPAPSGKNVLETPAPERTTQTKRILLISTGIVGILLILLASFWIFRHNQLQTVPTSTIGIIDQATNTLRAPSQSAEQLPTLTLTNPMIQATATLSVTPSITPNPTDTPTITPTFTQTPSILFSDDFSSGFSKWTVFSPKDAAIIDNKFTSTNARGTWIAVTLPNLNNFEIEIHGSALSTGVTGIIVSPAFVDPSNFLGFRTNVGDRNWEIFRKGGISFATDLERNGFFEEMDIVVKVINKNIQVTINGVNMTSFYNDKIPFGIIGLFCDTVGKIAKITISELK